MAVYTCESWLEGILCGVYDTWSEPADRGDVRLTIKGEYEESEPFTEYREIQSCPEKAKKVIHSVCAKLSQEIYRKVYTASLNQDRDQAGKIYRFLIQTFRHGPSVLGMLQLPACYGTSGLCRNVYNENHLLTGFLCSSEIPGGIPVSRINPKNDTMTLSTPHFVDRLPEENWVIYDENHKRAAVHPAGRSWFLVNYPPEPGQENSDQGWSYWLKERIDEKTCEDVRRMFCDITTIREHHSPVCQRAHLPLRF